MPSGAAETFTGADGSAPNATNITLATNTGSSPGAITVQTNRLRITAGSAIGNKTSARITGLSVADSETTFDWIVPDNSTAFGRFIVRSNTAVDGLDGYMIYCDANDLSISRSVAGVDSGNLVTTTHGLTLGQIVRCRVAMFGNRLRVRVWRRVDSEPTNVWQIDFTDTSGSAIAGPGAIGWLTTNAANGSPHNFIIDTVDVQSAITATLATLTAAGTIVPAGTLGKSPAKRLAGAVASAGVIFTTRVVPKAFAGAVALAGALRKVAPKTFSGVLAPTAVTVKVPAKRLAGTIATSATYSRRAARRFAGSIAPSGSTTGSFAGSVFGRPGIVVMRFVQDAIVRIRSREGG
jgi:hypothetical protein